MCGPIQKLEKLRERRGMNKPSDKAMLLALAIRVEQTKFIWAKSLWQSPNTEFDEVSAILIDTALAEARLEGAKAMQVYIAGYIKRHGDDTYRISSWNNPTDAYKMACRFLEEDSRALDPQQVINESVK